MAAITQPNSVKFPSQPESGDYLLQPLHWCGGQWNQLCAIDNDNGIFYKTTQVALRIIPAVVLALATFFAGAVGAAGSLIKSFSSSPKQDWAGQYIDVAMDARLKERCQEIGIDNADLRDWQISGKFNKKMPNDLFAGFSVTRSDCPFDGKIARNIRLSTSSLFLGRNICSGLYHDFTKCFENAPSPQEKVFSLEGLQHFLLGLDVAPEKRIELTNVIKSTREINLAISEDLNHFRITLV